MAFQETPAHTAIFSEIKNGKSNVVIEAVAGAGKTTTIVKALELIPASLSTVFLAFNKKIATELGARVPSHVQARTMHSLGNGAWMRYAKAFARPKIDGDKVQRIAKELMTDMEFRRMGGVALRLVGTAKNSGMVPQVEVEEGHTLVSKGLVDDGEDTFLDMMDHHDMQVDEGVSRSEVCDWAQRLLISSLQTLDVIDFDDMLYMPYAYGASFYQNDWVFVDEAQDLSPLQHVILRKALKPKGRLVAVGDPHQAIYGFRGADSNSLGTLADKFNCRRLPLHVSYRCPQLVVRDAQQVVGHIKAHESAPQGVVDRPNKDLLDCQPSAGDMVVCRTTAPVVREAFTLIRNKVPCVVLGRDIGRGLLTLIKKLKPMDVKDLATKLSKWETREVERLKRNNKESLAQGVHDKADTLRCFIERADHPGIDSVKDAIERMFDDNSSTNKVTLCTIHKAKGLEADTVFFLERDRLPPKWVKKDWQVLQEHNLIYVAITRAKRRLVYVPSSDD